MIVRQTSTTIVSLQLILLLLLSCHVTSISLSQFQQIQGFSISCENVWQVDIPGCSKRDFTNPNDCSRNCIAGVNIINAEVLVACSDARVSSNTLLAQFLAGYGVSALCGEQGGSTETTATIADSTTATATAIKTATTSTGLSSVQSTAATTTSTTTAVGVKSTQQSRTSITVDVTTSTSTSTLATTSSTSTPTIEPNLTLSFTETTSTASLTSSSSSTTSATSSKSSSTSNPEAKGFGGVGDANDILGGEGRGDRLACIPWEVMSLISILVVSIASAIW